MFLRSHRKENPPEAGGRVQRGAYNEGGIVAGLETVARIPAITIRSASAGVSLPRLPALPSSGEPSS